MSLISNNLPMEMHWIIFSILDAASLRTCAKLNNTIRSFILSEEFLQPFALKFGVPKEIPARKWLLEAIHSKEDFLKYINYCIKLVKYDDKIMLNIMSFSTYTIHLKLLQDTCPGQENFSDLYLSKDIWMDDGLISDTSFLSSNLFDQSHSDDIYVNSTTKEVLKVIEATLHNLTRKKVKVLTQAK